MTHAFTLVQKHTRCAFNGGGERRWQVNCSPADTVYQHPPFNRRSFLSLFHHVLMKYDTPGLFSFVNYVMSYCTAHGQLLLLFAARYVQLGLLRNISTLSAETIARGRGVQAEAGPLVELGLNVA